jgi:hypothetical protein
MDEKLNRRPPFTVAAVRYTPIVLDSIAEPSSSFRRGLAMDTTCPSELQTALPRRIGEGFQATVIPVPVSIEHYRFNAGSLRFVRNSFADFRGRCAVSALLQPPTLFDRGCGGNCPAASIVDDLCIDVGRSPPHSQPWPIGHAEHPLSDGAATPSVPGQLGFVSIHVN